MVSPEARRIHLTSALIVVGTFVAGAVAGAGVVVTFGRPPHGGPPPFGRGGGGPPHGPPWIEELGLTAEQRTEAEPIFEKHRAAVETVLQESLPRMRAANDAMERELEPVLTELQRARLHEAIQRRPGPPMLRGGPPHGGPPPGGPPPGGPPPGGPPPGGPPPGGPPPGGPPPGGPPPGGPPPDAP